MEFTTLTDGTKISNVSKYIKEYLKKYENEYYIEVVVGTDSQNKKRHTEIASVIFLHKTSYDSGIGKGGHVLYRKKSIPRPYAKTEVERREYRKLRLLKEAEESLEIANILRENHINVDFIDLDLNPSDEFKSNEVLQEAMGWVKGSGFTPRYKPNAPAASYASDHLIKH
jgi:predicted RNase H-related nuclease YkuK (DUF458 family)